MAAIALAPLLPLWLAAALAIPALALLGRGFVRRTPGTGWRLIALAALALAIANPSLVAEDREALPDTVLLVADRSPSQGIGARTAQADAALARLEERFARLAGLELRRIEAAGTAAAGTRLFEALAAASADLPAAAVAGVVVATDGAVHDLPPTLAAAGIDAPLHVLLTGRQGEGDRRLEVVQAPRYGIVDKPVVIAFRIHDEGHDGGRVPVTLTVPGAAPVTHDVPVGDRYEMSFTPDRAGPFALTLEAGLRQGELTAINNAAALTVNGVRENLKVLLISGEAHSGERTWRNTLKSDPAVELVHFTILRPPEKQDATPLRELALISFPVRELFELRLHDFDLIVFDRYRKRGLISEQHLQAVADYVRAGGAVMIAAGPDFATPLGLHATPLQDVLPALPQGAAIEAAFRPRPSAAGRRHPVTAVLAGDEGAPPPWGRWFRQVPALAHAGTVLLEGIEGRPLLVLHRAGEGRVAQLLSDHLWLWARGYDGGGPSGELLRRLAHWLMKEPDLEEEALTAAAADGRIRIARRSMEERAFEVEITSPSGARRTLALAPLGPPGRAGGEIAAEEAGLYRIAEGERQAVAVIGGLNPLEWRDPRATAAPLAPLVAEGGGGLVWLAHETLPAVRRVQPGRDLSGEGWIGVIDRRRYAVRGIRRTALLPPWLALLLLPGAFAAAWRAEGR